MTWTYTYDLDGDTTDAVRFLIGDTDKTDQLLQDEEINWLLSEYGDSYSAAAAACLTIGAKFSRDVTKKVGDLSLNASDKAKQYFALAKELTAKAATRTAVPYAGGISVADKNSRENNTDRVDPKFTKGMFDYAETSPEGSRWSST